MSMKTVTIHLEDWVDQEEFYKSISFVSPEIQSAVRKPDAIEFVVSEDVDASKLLAQLEEISKKFTKGKEEEVYFKNEREIETYTDLKEENENLLDFGNGQIGFLDKGKFLMEYFDGVFCEMAKSLNACEKIYPALLPLKEYAETGYVKKTPQYAIFCNSVNDSMDDLEKVSTAIETKQVRSVVKEPEYALSPSACFHTYIEYCNKVLDGNTLVTFRQNVFRNEGRFNYAEVGRLMDYHVREIVMLGDGDYVVQMRDIIMNKVVELMKEYGLKGDISQATDSFVMPKMQRYKKIQRIDKSKYEMHLYVTAEKAISVASFNLHGKAFTDPFHIMVAGCEDAITGCVGFGLQRWVLAFIAQYGWEESAWPEMVKNAYLSQRR